MRWATYAVFLLFPGLSWAAFSPMVVDIKGTSLEDLMRLKISSLTRKDEYARTSPAAVSVMTADDVRRLGVTHIAEALRYIPGVEVARLEANKWSISIRGFNSRTANKLLVMIDGRSIYSPLFSGVLWEEKDVSLEDLDRIEVVRGPGGAAWGANAVNGVINIITKKAKDTQGYLVKAGAGLEDRGYAVARSGWRSSDNSYTRVYGKSVRRDDGGGNALDDDHGEMNQVGFKHDLTLGEGESFSFQGDLYRHQIGPEFEDIVTVGQEDKGGNLLATWRVDQENGLSQNAFFYYDETSLYLKGFIDKRNTWNFDYQQSLKWERHYAVWGTGYRFTEDNIETFPADFVSPESRKNETASVFFNDDISLARAWHVIVGTKLEKNDYSGTEWQPNVRTSYDFGTSFLWASWSKAVRIPTRLERDIGTVLSPDAGVGFNPEYVTFKEVGFRWFPADQFSMSTSLFHADYTDLLSIEGTHLDNNNYGDTQGLEMAAAYQVTKDWLIKASISAMTFDLQARSYSIDSTTVEGIEGSTPDSRVVISSFLNVNPNWQLNVFLRYVDSLEALNVESYLVGDITVSWIPSKEWEVQVAARNLGDDEHPEWGPLPRRLNQYTEVETDVVAFVTWRFL